MNEPPSVGVPMYLLVGVIKALLMMVVLALVIGGVAALFMVVFGIATGIDENIQS